MLERRAEVLAGFCSSCFQLCAGAGRRGACRVLLQLLQLCADAERRGTGRRRGATVKLYAFVRDPARARNTSRNWGATANLALVGDLERDR